MSFKCEVIFNQNPYGIYFAGQILSGRVEISVDKIKKVKGIYLLFTGNAKCAWTEQHGSNKNRRTIRFVGKEEYMSTKIQLFGNFNTGTQLEISPGLHTYNFSCALPSMLPTSFEGTFGHIRYTVSVVFERPWKFDQTHKVAFTVLKQFDLNYDSPILRIPSQMEITKSFCCGPCSSGPFSIVAQIPQTGYVPGQDIVALTEVTNMSYVTVQEMKFILRKIITYHSQIPMTKIREEIVELVEKRTGGVPKRDHGRFQVTLTIPAVPPTNVTLCRVIHVKYDIKIEAKLSGPHINPYICIPITIGTIPLNNNSPDPKTPAITTSIGFVTPTGVITTQPTPYQQGGTDGTAPPSIEIVNDNNTIPITNPIINRSNINQDLPPPSYEESVNASNYQQLDDENEGSGQTISKPYYAPRYPVYNFQNLNNARETIVPIPVETSTNWNNSSNNNNDNNNDNNNNNYNNNNYVNNAVSSTTTQEKY